MIRVASVGECMIELNQRDATTLGLAYGGDTFNTALYLARVTDRAVLAVDYVTALGDDPYSAAMEAMWQGEGIGLDAVARLPGRLPGLYLIRLDEKGERHFYYYRSAAAARELFRAPETERLLARLAGYDLVYLSLITLSVLSELGRDRLFAALGELRARGGRVAFDTNFRPAAWTSPAAARREAERFLARVDIALPTADDDRALFGDRSLDEALARYAALGIEAAVKLGADGCVALATDGRRERVPVPAPVTPVDTTAAGDAFNAGYLAARLAGRPQLAAARAGHIVAAAVIRHRGAIIPRAATPALPD
jgi:2-dehydro-3-deoxygluconokinase